MHTKTAPQARDKLPSRNGTTLQDTGKQTAHGGPCGKNNNGTNTETGGMHSMQRCRRDARLQTNSLEDDTVDVLKAMTV